MANIITYVASEAISEEKKYGNTTRTLENEWIKDSKTKNKAI